MATLAVKQLQLAPLGAGDLIDRTVRLYRRHFGALVRASFPPVVLSAAGWVVMAVSFRAMGSAASEGRVVVYFLTAFLGFGVWVAGLLAQLLVMGGASRNLVMHLLWGEPVTARLIYRSVRSRFWKLFGATLVVFFWLLVSWVVAAIAWMLLWGMGMVAISVMAAATRFQGDEWWAVALFFISFLAPIVPAFWLFFLIAGRVAYVPQVLMVEGCGVFDSVGRSSGLARGNLRRLMGMFLFTTFAGYSALMLLLFPLGWFAYLNGVNPFEFDATRLPAWYTISSEVLGQVATVLLAPVWMLGLSLLYVDERVRHEGYDIELLAAQVFGEMPSVPAGLRSPLAPAIAAPQPPAPAHAATSPPPAAADEPSRPGSVLGL